MERKIALMLMNLQHLYLNRISGPALYSPLNSAYFCFENIFVPIKVRHIKKVSTDKEMSQQCMLIVCIHILNFVCVHIK